MACCCTSADNKVRPFKDKEESLDDGPNKDRQCRDIIFLLIFIAFMCGMVGIACLGIVRGDPYRLIYGVDSWGNTCNRNNDPITGAIHSGKDMTDMKKSFYFDQMYFASYIPNGPVLQEKKYLRTCVKSCPGQLLQFESSFNDYYNTTGNNLCRHGVVPYEDVRDKCPSLPITPHVSLFHRCIPKNIADIAAAMAKSFTNVLGSVSLGDGIPQKILSDLNTAWKEILYLCGIAFATSLLIVMMMWLLAAIIIWTMIIAVCAFTLGVSAYSWYSYYGLYKDYNALTAAEQTEAAEQKVQTWLIYSGIASVITAIVLLLLFIMRKRIALVVQLFEEAGKAIKAMPLLLLQPMWTLLALLGVVTGLAAVAAYIETSGIPVVDDTNSTVTFQFEEHWNYVRWYHLFGLLWTSAFVIACQDMVIAGAVSIWFFTRNKNKLGMPICSSIKRLIRYHLGSIAFGSFIIALVRLLRLILGYIQRKLKGRVGKVAEFLMKMLQCCLWCFEKCLAFLNRNAYIEIAIYGYSFCASARKALMVLLANALRVAAINSIGDFILFLGKISCVCIVAVAGNEFLKHRDDINYAWAPISVACAFAFAISHCFILVYEITIDTIFLCFCEDCEMNDGVTKPFYMSKDLMVYLEKSKQEAAREVKKKKTTEKTTV
ncbi:LOW QUALITY PROTEIN: choline transporter-like protein 1 [Pecten maximus]|uniref:LOW QUALITY PROTEIN: choline transporter-like protein 1 n=1 Tax=Pecten maximus TaxID=6579 RepID=UPI001458CC9C|nr:LOW QUALITY PROTEIN: choline transporter-like protein 1 [Pecten maximus]